MDHPTTAMARPSIARMCVEIDLSKELPKRIGVKVKGVMVWQKIVYENKLLYCSNCRMQGHNTMKCRRYKSALPSSTIPPNTYPANIPNSNQNSSHTTTHTINPQSISKNQPSTSTNHHNNSTNSRANNYQKNHNPSEWQQVNRNRNKKRSNEGGEAPNSSVHNRFTVLEPVMEETATEVEDTSDSEVDENIEAGAAPDHARADEFVRPPVARAEAFEVPPPVNVEGEAVVHEQMAVPIPTVVVEETSLSPGLAQLCSDVAAATKVNWTEDHSNLMNANNDMIFDAQRSGASLEGMNQSDTPIPLASTNDSGNTDGDLEESRVAVDSEGNTLVKETPQDDSMS